MTNERQQFLEHRDINKDGKMDREEIGHWILPPDYDHAEVESKHLLVQSDKDLVRIIHEKGVAILRLTQELRYVDGV